MKVLVHLNHGVDKSYLLNFKNRLTKVVIEKVLRHSQEDSAELIYGYAEILGCVRKIEIPEAEKLNAAIEADFVVGSR